MEGSGREQGGGNDKEMGPTGGEGGVRVRQRGDAKEVEDTAREREGQTERWR